MNVKTYRFVRFVVGLLGGLLVPLTVLVVLALFYWAFVNRNLPFENKRKVEAEQQQRMRDASAEYERARALIEAEHKK